MVSLVSWYYMTDATFHYDVDGPTGLAATGIDPSCTAWHRARTPKAPVLIRSLRYGRARAIQSKSSGPCDAEAPLTRTISLEKRCHIYHIEA